MCGSVYGPTSGRQDDRTLFRLAQFDEYLTDRIHFHGANNLYCTYGNEIFAGFWTCVRTRHEPTPDLPLTPAQEIENDNMKAVCESIEQSYGRAEELWPLLNKKKAHILELDPAMVFGQFHIMYFLTNCKVAAEEGSMMTGRCMFACQPLTLQEYLSSMEP